MKIMFHSQSRIIAGAWPDLVEGNATQVMDVTFPIPANATAAVEEETVRVQRQVAVMMPPQPQVPEGFELADVAGDPNTYEWPHPNGASACLYVDGNVVANEAVPLPK